MKALHWRNHTSAEPKWLAFDGPRDVKHPRQARSSLLDALRMLWRRSSSMTLLGAIEYRAAVLKKNSTVLCYNFRLKDWNCMVRSFRWGEGRLQCNNKLYNYTEEMVPRAKRVHSSEQWAILLRLLRNSSFYPHYLEYQCCFVEILVTLLDT